MTAAAKEGAARRPRYQSGPERGGDRIYGNGCTAKQGLDSQAKLSNIGSAITADKQSTFSNLPGRVTPMLRLAALRFLRERVKRSSEKFQNVDSFKAG